MVNDDGNAKIMINDDEKDKIDGDQG